jgi:lysozyme
MKISPTFFAHLKKTEAIRKIVYDDATGKEVASYAEVKGAPTIAVGKKIQPHEQNTFKKHLKGGTKLDGAALETVIQETITPREAFLTKKLTVPVTQGMFDALFSFMYNTGEYAKTFKNVLAKVNAGDYKGAHEAIAKGPTTSGGKTMSGLVKRRAHEAELFASEGLNPGKSAMSGPDYGAVYEMPVTNMFGKQVGTRRVSTGALYLYAAGRGLSGVVSGFILGGAAGFFLPGLSMKQGAKWGAAISGAGGLIYGLMKAEDIKATSKQVG